MKINDYLKALCVLSSCTLLGPAKVQALDCCVGYMYVQLNDETVGGCYIFENAFYNAGSDPYCSENHRDPDGNKYSHAHTWEAFPFWDNEEYVTIDRSDMAWDRAKTDYVRVSSSTFLVNCYSYATDAPTPLASDGWVAFTNPSSMAEVTTKKKSFPVPADHCIVITATAQILEDSPILVTGTIEKCSSGGVYSKSWPNGLNATNVRKKKN
jgi:hypothetical protein